VTGAFNPSGARSEGHDAMVINGVLAAPVMIMLMVLVRRQRVMGEHVVTGPLYWLGWASTVA